MHPFPSMSRALFAFLFVLIAASSRADVPSTLDEDPLPEGSSWSGKFMQSGTYPNAVFSGELDATLTITGRAGNRVELELHETGPGMDLTFICRGQLTRSADHSLSLEFRSLEAKAARVGTVYILDVLYSAKITGDSIKGCWCYVDTDAGVDLRGNYSLARQ
jgi:hypothetical protein